MKLKFTCASAGEKAQTITVNQLTGKYDIALFTYGSQFRIYFTNGTFADAYVNRDFKTLYIPAANLPKGFKRASVGNPVSRTIKNIKSL